MVNNNNILVKKSFAKINLYLEVIGNDNRGYHLLDSLMTFIDIYDIIKITQNNDLSLEIKGPYSKKLKNNNNNIIIQTVELLAKKYNFTPKIKISLTKNIPLGAGLGGGSSNAASIVLMLNKLYQLNLPPEELTQIGLELGCDVPFFINQKIALISGIGEKVTEVNIDKEDLFILLMNPNQHLSTKKVFEIFKSQYSKILKNNTDLTTTNNETNLIDLIKNRHNHLEEPANDLVPQIYQIISELSKQNNCLISRMSGSGATCFGLFKSQHDLKSAKENMANKFPEFYIKESKVIYNI